MRPDTRLPGKKTVIEKIDIIKPDFVIGSLHFIDGLDVYHGVFFEGKTKQEAYDHYFEKLLSAIKPLSEYFQYNRPPDNTYQKALTFLMKT